MSAERAWVVTCEICSATKFFTDRTEGELGAAIREAGWSLPVYGGTFCARCTEAVKTALAGRSGVIGNDEGKKGAPLRAIEFPRIKGGKAFNTHEKWFGAMLKDMGQPMGKPVEGKGH